MLLLGTAFPAYGYQKYDDENMHVRNIIASMQYRSRIEQRAYEYRQRFCRIPRNGIPEWLVVAVLLVLPPLAC